MSVKFSKKRAENLRNFAEKFYDPHFSKVNPDWKNQWKYVIQREYPWNGVFDLVMYKIKTLKEYLEALRNDEFNFKFRITDESIDKQLKQIDEVLTLGQKIYDDKYQDDAWKWYEENSKYIIKIYKITDFTKNYPGIPGNYIPDGFEVIGEFESNKSKCLVLDLDFEDDTDMTVDRWCKEHNINRKTVRSVSIHEWTNDLSEEENSANFNKKLQNAYKERKSDIKKFYSLIAKYDEG